MRTAESVVFTCWPPLPEDRYVSIRRSFSSIIDFDRVVDFGIHGNRSKRRVPALRGIERRNADQAMDSGFRSQQAVSILADDREGHGLDSGFFTVLVHRESAS